MIKKIIKKILKKAGIYNPLVFTTSQQYWIARYKKGGNSGSGSYNRLAVFKAEVINKFIKENNISTVIEFGCGDGNQLRYFNFPSYTGYDISPMAVKRCANIFKNDKSKTFKLLSDKICETADLVLSLDVIFHLVEDITFMGYMERLFHSSKKFVIIYASNYDKQIIINGQASHVRHRKFTEWIDENATNFKLIEHIPNKYPFKEDEPDITSFADFYIFEKQV
ncbi:MAG: class I SAM-dependent methyltransferase [Prevotellaceae bacterium]|jgi:cyclopropane fatty-acyl-phospholipid synthase-like methyltransferase|nr:class I SAM-dependent methyltransferase [Prevotellaceae bacterium]